MSGLPDDILSRLAAEREITEVLVRYCHAVDRADEELLRTVYHDDAFDDHRGFYQGPAAGFATFLMAALRERFDATMHQLSNVRIEINGTTAAVQSYYIATHVLRGRATRRVFGGRYLDRFEHRDGEWRIAHRLVMHDWDVSQPCEELRQPSDSRWNEGVRSPDDPSYGLFASIAAGRPWPGPVQDE